jgi:hypothetical protein
VTHSRESGLVDYHPEDERQRLLDGSQKQSIFLDTRTDDTNEKLKDIGKEMSDDLHDPETQPDCLDCQQMQSMWVSIDVLISIQNQKRLWSVPPMLPVIVCV